MVMLRTERGGVQFCSRAALVAAQTGMPNRMEGCKRGLDALGYSELVLVGRQPNGGSGWHAAEQLARRTDIGLSTAIIEVGSVEGRLLAGRLGGIRRLDECQHHGVPRRRSATLEVALARQEAQHLRIGGQA